MKSLTLISTSTLCVAMMSCSTAANTPVTSTGGQTTSTGGSGATAGSTVITTGGAGNTTSMGGAGNTTSMGGAGNETSTGGVGNTTSTGGTDTGGTGGTTTIAGGTGGTATTGGTGAGGGSAGTGTAGTSPGGASSISVAMFAGAFDGALLQYPCGSGSPNYDCNQPTPCAGVSAGNPNAPVIAPAGGAASKWVMNGTVGTKYNVKLHIQGVVEVSWYHGGTRSAGTSSIDVGSTVPGAQSYAKDLFQTGGTGLTYADQGNGFDYNQYELDVTPAGGGAPTVYFLNAVIPGENPHTSSKTQHLSFEIDELPTIVVPGGATISLTVRDSNCVEIQNCGTQNNSASCQQGARSEPFTGSMPPPPASWTGKVTSGTGGNLGGQVVHFDVISVTAAP